MPNWRSERTGQDEPCQFGYYSIAMLQYLHSPGLPELIVAHCSLSTG